MKLYAVVDKETKTLFAQRQHGDVGVFVYQDLESAQVACGEHRELVTLREEPSEPCWHCKGINRQDPDNVWRDKFCRKCGRSLE